MDFNFDFNSSSNKNEELELLEPMTISVTHRLQNGEADFKIFGEDHTLAEIIREQLLLDKRVQFAGCRKDHPLDKHIRIKIKLEKQYNPTQGQNLDSSVVIINCLKLAVTNAIETCLVLRNDIPDTQIRTNPLESNLQNQISFDFDPINLNF